MLRIDVAERHASPTPQGLRRKRPRPQLVPLTIDIPADSTRACELVRGTSDENLTSGKSSSRHPSPSLLSCRAPGSRSSVSCSPSLGGGALRHLSPNFVRPSYDVPKGSRTPPPPALSLAGGERVHGAGTNDKRGKEKPIKKARPNLTLDLSVLTTPSSCPTTGTLSLRRQGSWEEGSLADNTVENSATLSEEAARKAEAFAYELSENGVKLLAVDFDLTLASMHTGGKWWGTAETLGRSIRPLFKTIIPAAQSLGIEVCIVTFSGQTKLISNVLKSSLMCDTSKITIRGGESKRTLVREDGDLDTAQVAGTRKQKHICSVIQARMARGESAVKPEEVMLIDDDVMNVDEAIENGNQALLFDPDNPMFLVSAPDPASSPSPFDFSLGVSGGWN